MNFYVILILEDFMEEKKDFYTLFSKVVKYNPEKDYKKEKNLLKINLLKKIKMKILKKK